MSSGFIKDGKYVPVNSAVSIDSDYYYRTEVNKHIGVEYSYNVTGLKPGVYLCRLEASYGNVDNITAINQYNYSMFNGVTLGARWPVSIIHGRFAYQAQFIVVTAEQAAAGVPLKIRIGNNSSIGGNFLQFNFIAKRVG